MKELDGKDLISLAQKRVEENNLDGAIEVFDEIVRRTKAQIPMPIFSRATCFIQLGKFEEAIADCKLILQLPDGPIDEGLVAGSTTLHSAVYSRLNNAYKSLNKIEEAAEALKSRSLLEEEERRKIGNREDSERTSSTEKSTNPKEPAKSSSTNVGIPEKVKSKVEILKKKANNLYQEGKFEEAIKIYKLALEHYSENEVIHSNISQAFIKTEKFNDALFHANEAVRISPEWAKGYYRQGMALLKLKEFKAATESLQTALQLAPEDQLISSLLSQSMAQNAEGVTSMLNPHLLTFLIGGLACLCAAHIIGLVDMGFFKL